LAEADGSVAAAMGRWVMRRRSSPPGGVGRRNQTETPLGPPFAACAWGPVEGGDARLASVRREVASSR